MATSLDEHPVAKLTPVLAGLREDWARATALLGGTKTMRAAGTSYLPQWPNEKDDSYKTRLSISTLFPAYGRTVSTLTGKPFSRPITLPDGLNAQLKEWFDDIDLQGTNIGVYSAKLFHTALGKGLAGVIVDCPPRGDTPNSVQAERTAGIRPYFAEVRAEDLLGWQAQLVEGKWRLTQLRFYEHVEIQDGPYAAKCITQIRVWNIGNYEIWRKNPADNTWYVFDSKTVSINFVPFQPFYGAKAAYMVGLPPLLDLAYLNVKHWQSQSDQDTLLHVARVPILTVTTDDDKFELTVGSSTGIRIPIGAEVKFVEHTGKAIEAGAKSLAELKDEMRQSGAELLVLRMTQATATEVNADNSVGTCDLQRMTVEFEGSLNAACDMLTQWVNQTMPGKLAIYKDFGALNISDASSQILLDSTKSGLLSDETFFKELQRRGAVDAATKWEDEKARIAAQPPKVDPAADPNADPNKPDPTKNAKPPLKQ